MTIRHVNCLIQALDVWVVGQDTGCMTLMTSHLTRLRDELRERRRTRAADRAAHRELETQLASYVRTAEVDDLLASMSDYDGPEAEQIRSILFRKLAEDRSRVFAA
jgi:hypothetical protein